MFKKVVIADQCAIYANDMFNNTSNYESSSLVIGAVLFAFQIYGDFSGYSDIALGTARLFGIELLRNFAFPYFSRDIAEFWRRWHISLSTWFRDYLYIPLGGSKVGVWTKVRNTFIIFIVSGFWHGANWTFIVWGLLNALYIMPSIIFNTNRQNIEIVANNSFLPNIKEALSMLVTFTLTVFAWIFFRANSVQHAFKYISLIFTNKIFSKPVELSGFIIVMILFFLGIEWIGRRDKYGLEKILINHSVIWRWGLYFVLIACVFVFNGKEQQFIYFQF